MRVLHRPAHHPGARCPANRNGGCTRCRRGAAPPFFSDRERAAPALVEAVAQVATGHVPDDVYESAARHFDEAELARLIWTAVAADAWNRAAVATRLAPR